MNTIKAVLVENLERPHRAYRRLLERIDGVQLLGAFFSPEDLIAQLDAGLRPDVIVSDVRMDDDLRGPSIERLDGIEAARQIRARFPRIAIILYSMWDNTDFYRRIEQIRLTNRFAFLKRSTITDSEMIGEIIRRVVRGEIYIDQEVRAEMDLLKDRRQNSPLTLLEHEDQHKVLALLADGLSNDEIAKAVGRRLRWVEEMVKNIYEALNLSNLGSGDSRRIRAARMYQEDRILTEGDQARIETLLP